MCRVVPTDRNDLATRNDGSQEPHGIELEALTGELNRHGNGVTGEHRYGLGCLPLSSASSTMPY